MLQKQTIEPETLSVLNKIMDIPFLTDFQLVGGTALALKYGHRKSIDLDLFTNKSFEKQTLIEILETTFKSSFAYDGKSTKWGLFCFIDNVKVDFVHYPHPIIGQYEVVENIRLASNKDLVAMKIQAILGRGAKKDFWDVAELLKYFSLQEMIDFHGEKFPTQMLGISIPQALVYFEDAESTPEPISLNNLNWTDIKLFIREKVSEYLK